MTLIPARGGSKRIPHKNIKLLAGRPLISYTLDVAKQALKMGIVDKIVVSTDDGEIKKVVENEGIEVPFLRPSEFALDNTPDIPVLRHALDFYKKKGKDTFDIIIYLRPTTPFKTVEDINAVIRRMVEKPVEVCRSVTKVTGVFHPFWMFENKNSLLVPVCKNDVRKYYQRQLLPTIYRLNGVVDGATVDFIRNTSASFLLSEKMSFVEIPEDRLVDIDSEDDIFYAEYLMSKKNVI